MMDYKFQQLNSLIKIINEKRTKRWFYKKDPLILDEKLMNHAQNWANKIAYKDKLFNSDLEEIKKLGYKEAAEIISYSFMEPKDLIENSMKNDKDKNKILDEKFTNIGCGMSLSQNGKLYWCIFFSF